MKKHITIIFSLLFILSLQAQDKAVSQKDFEEYKKETTDNLKEIKSGIKDIGKRVDNGAETHKIAREYSESADKLQSIFLAFLGLLMAAAAILAGLGFYKHFKINEKIAEYERELDRILKTENETIALKENSGILILHKGTHEASTDAFKTLEKSIVGKNKKEKNYKNTGHASLDSLKDFKPDIFQKNGIANRCQPKVIVLNDDLFDEFKTDVKIQKDKKELIAFFKKLENNNIGLVLFGQTFLRDFDLSYLAFANQPYSVYANLNNLLKYMNVTQK